MKEPTPERNPYEGNQCGKAFVHQSLLQIHKSTPKGGGKNYHCNQCDKALYITVVH